MGSGGRVLGRMLADRLGMAFYDRQMLCQAAQKAGLSAEFFERNDERRPGFTSGMMSLNMGLAPMAWHNTPSTSDTLYHAQCKFMHEIAAKGPCVIVGRSADYVLRDLPNLLNVFVHASPDDCIRRVLEREPDRTPAEAAQFIERANRDRRNFYNFYTDKRWGEAASYDLCFNSSHLTLDEIADIIVAHIANRKKQ